MRTVIYGSRPDGQAKVIAELVANRPDLELVGLVDDFPENRDRSVRGLRVLGTSDDLEALRRDGVEALLVGFGESRGRAKIVERAKDAGFALPSLVHESAVVCPSARIGPGAQVFPCAYVGPDVRLGDGAFVSTCAVVEHDVVIESGAVIFPNATVTGRVHVGRDVTIGAGAVVLPDISVGEEAIVGAGAVVVRDVLPAERVAGIPARPLS